jgi:cell division protein FtsQ
VPLRLKLLAAAVALLALLAGAWRWLRDAAPFRVRTVQVTGVVVADGDRLRAALESAAREMSTLHVRKDVLRAAARPYPSVRDLRVRTDFPHAMTITVVEHRPVAALVRGGERVPVTSAGLVLRDLPADADVPELAQSQPPAGDRVSDARTRAALAVAGAAPAPLLHRALRLGWGPRGLVLNVRSGPDLIFGSASQAGAKWAAATRVLAEPSAAGAVYLDLREPGRVAAGGLEPVPTATPAGAPTNPQPQGENPSTLSP